MKTVRFPFRYLEPTFFAGLLDDPVLWVKIRPWGRSLLFDCGQIHHLAKRVLKSLAAVFVSHAHMDHFMGFDTLLRSVLVSPRVFDVFGPPGIVAKVEHKLAAYDWNLQENFWCSFRVHEVFPERIRTCLFPGPEGFVRRHTEERPRHDRVIFANDWVRVAAEQSDHGIPVLLFRVTEREAFVLDDDRLARAGLRRGPWIGQLKNQFFRGRLGCEPLWVPNGDSGTAHMRRIEDTARLYRDLRRAVAPPALGYLTDLGYSEVSRHAVVDLLRGVSLLVGECAFPREGLAKARRSRHLCTTDVNELLKALRPAFYLPMHLSKSCEGRSRLLYEELCPPPGCRLLKCPERLNPRPLLPRDVPWRL